MAIVEPLETPGPRRRYRALSPATLAPLGEFDCASAEDVRAAEVLAPPAPISARMQRFAQNPTSMSGRAFFNPPAPTAVINTRAWRAAEIPSSNGHTTARAIARIYGALACGGAMDGIRLLSAESERQRLANGARDWSRPSWRQPAGGMSRSSPGRASASTSAAST